MSATQIGRIVLWARGVGIPDALCGDTASMAIGLLLLVLVLVLVPLPLPMPRWRSACRGHRLVRPAAAVTP